MEMGLGLWNLKLLGFHARFAGIWFWIMGEDPGLNCNVAMNFIWVSLIFVFVAVFVNGLKKRKELAL